MVALITRPVDNLDQNPRRLLSETRGSAILEFAIALPLLVVFIVGIYDFGGAFNQKQKIEQAAQEGAIVAGALPTSDLVPESGTTLSVQPVAVAVLNSLAGSGVIIPSSSGNACNLSSPPPPVKSPRTLTWTYTFTDCPYKLVVKINRGWTGAISQSGQSGLYAVGTVVTVTYPYHWSFNSAIQLLIPGANYAAPTLSESATVHNQM